MNKIKARLNKRFMRKLSSNDIMNEVREYIRDDWNDLKSSSHKFVHIIDKMDFYSDTAGRNFSKDGLIYNGINNGQDKYYSSVEDLMRDVNNCTAYLCLSYDDDMDKIIISECYYNNTYDEVADDEILQEFELSYIINNINNNGNNDYDAATIVSKLENLYKNCHVSGIVL